MLNEIVSKKFKSEAARSFYQKEYFVVKIAMVIAIFYCLDLLARKHLKSVFLLKLKSAGPWGVFYYEHSGLLYGCSIIVLIVSFAFLLFRRFFRDALLWKLNKKFADNNLGAFPKKYEKIEEILKNEKRNIFALKLNWAYNSRSYVSVQNFTDQFTTESVKRLAEPLAITFRNDFVEIKLDSKRNRYIISFDVLPDKLSNSQIQLVKPGTFYCGINSKGKAAVYDPAVSPGISIHGPTGAGKSMLISLILKQVLLLDKRKTKHLIIVDPKLGEDFLHVVPKDDLKVLQVLDPLNEIDLKKLRDTLKNLLSEYTENRKGKSSEDKIVLLFDEASLFLRTKGLEKAEKELVSEIVRLTNGFLQLMRSRRYVMIIGTQEVNSEALDISFTNVLQRFFAHTSATQSKYLIGSELLEDESFMKGKWYFKKVGDSGVVRTPFGGPWPEHLKESKNKSRDDAEGAEGA